MICYNNPLAYVVDITPQMFVELAEIKNLVAIKESSGDIRRITDLRNAVGDRYALFAGSMTWCWRASCSASTAGSRAWASRFRRKTSSSGIWPRAGTGTRPREMYRWFTPLLHLDTPVKFVQYIKLAIQETGLGAEWVRAPRLPLEGEERERARRSFITASKRDHRFRCGAGRHDARIGSGSSIRTRAASRRASSSTAGRPRHAARSPSGWHVFASSTTLPLRRRERAARLRRAGRRAALRARAIPRARPA